VVHPPEYHPSAEVSEYRFESASSPEPILKLNVASLLRKNWEDPLHAYLTTGEQAANANRNRQVGFPSEWGDK
jgi:hypothetical protein